MEVERFNKFVFEDDEKGIKFEAEALNGKIFEFSERTSGVLSIRACKLPIVSNNVLSKLHSVAAGEYATVLSCYTDNYGYQAVVPAGWTVSGINKENTIWGKNLGLVIYRIPANKVGDIDWTNPDEVETLQKTYDQLVWIPVCHLKANGTLDGVSFTEKFGRRNYKNDEFSEREFHEALNGKLALQFESVKKYGGFYISRYKISSNKKTEKPQSVKGVKPLVDICYYGAYEDASTIEDNEEVKSHLTFGTEYDSVLEWFIETRVKTLAKIAEDSNWKEGYANNIFVDKWYEWTQERNGEFFSVIRGGKCNFHGFNYPVCHRHLYTPGGIVNHIGFRATLYIK